MNHLSKKITSILIALLFVFAPSAHAQTPWTAPTDVFPFNNAIEPINIGTGVQSKIDGTGIDFSGAPAGYLSSIAGIESDNIFSLKGIFTDDEVYARRFCIGSTGIGDFIANNGDCITSWNDLTAPNGDQEGDTLYWDESVTPAAWKQNDLLSVKPIDNVVTVDGGLQAGGGNDPFFKVRPATKTVFAKRKAGYGGDLLDARVQNTLNIPILNINTSWWQGLRVDDNGFTYNDTLFNKGAAYFVEDLSTATAATPMTMIYRGDVMVNNGNTVLDGLFSYKGETQNQNYVAPNPGDVLTAVNADGLAEWRSSRECNDGIDNDGDGFTDYANNGGGDPDCSGPNGSESAPIAQCNDGIDNDGNGFADYAGYNIGGNFLDADPGCSGPEDMFEMQILPQCSDGIDNDGDGLKDYNSNPGFGDPDCFGDDDNDEGSSTNKPQCNDGIDNDGDGQIDAADINGCMGPLDNDEANTNVDPGTNFQTSRWFGSKWEPSSLMINTGEKIEIKRATSQAGWNDIFKVFATGNANGGLTVTDQGYVNTGNLFVKPSAALHAYKGFFGDTSSVNPTDAQAASKIKLNNDGNGLIETIGQGIFGASPYTSGNVGVSINSLYQNGPNGLGSGAGSIASSGFGFFGGQGFFGNKLKVNDGGIIVKNNIDSGTNFLADISGKGWVALKMGDNEGDVSVGFNSSSGIPLRVTGNVYAQNPDVTSSPTGKIFVPDPTAIQCSGFSSQVTGQPGGSVDSVQYAANAEVADINTIDCGFTPSPGNTMSTWNVLGNNCPIDNQQYASRINQYDCVQGQPLYATNSPGVDVGHVAYEIYLGSAGAPAGDDWNVGTQLHYYAQKYTVVQSYTQGDQGNVYASNNVEATNDLKAGNNTRTNTLTVTNGSSQGAVLTDSNGSGDAVWVAPTTRPLVAGSDKIAVVRYREELAHDRANDYDNGGPNATGGKARERVAMCPSGYILLTGGLDCEQTNGNRVAVSTPYRSLTNFTGHLADYSGTYERGGGGGNGSDHTTYGEPANGWYGRCTGTSSGKFDITVTAVCIKLD